MKPAITFSRAEDSWLRGLPREIRENGRTLSGNTIRIYTQAFERAGKILGGLALDRIDNEVIRDFVAAMRTDGYSPATICSDLIVGKLVVESITRDGDPAYPLRIKRKFARVPRIITEEQNAPCATLEEIERALSHPELAGPVVLAAGLGLRISEALALRFGNCPGLDSWDSGHSVVHIRATLKTSASRRSIPVPREIGEFLQRITAVAPGELLFSVSRSRLYNLLDSRDLPAPHAYRRFFTTIKDQADMNPNALKKILGHAKGSDITFGRYSRAADDMNFLQSEMERCALGFSLPALTSSSVAHHSSESAASLRPEICETTSSIT